jgi:hypothetical protein
MRFVIQAVISVALSLLTALVVAPALGWPVSAVYMACFLIGVVVATVSGWFA